MNSEQLTQLLLVTVIFGAVVLVLRTVVEAFVRYKALRAGVTPETTAGVLDAERAAQRISALRWGLLATGQAAALLTIHLLKLPVNSAAALACLFLGAGAALLIFFAMTAPATRGSQT